MTEDLSTKMRCYLAEIYRLYDREHPEDGYVATSSLADILCVTAPAVNRMINRLKELNMLEHEPYKGVKLTESGQKLALKQLRDHRIAECFLSTVMGIPFEEVYQEAQNISGAMSDTILDRMTAMSGNPSVCPHGEPIPQADGTMEMIEDELLSEIETGQRVQITRLRTRDIDRLNYIQALGLTPNTELDVIHRAPFDGPMQLRIDNEYRIIGHNLAELIRAKAIKDE